MSKTLAQSRLLDMIADQAPGSDEDYLYSRGALNFAIRLGFVRTADPFYAHALEQIEGRLGKSITLRGRDAAAVTVEGREALASS